MSSGDKLFSHRTEPKGEVAVAIKLFHREKAVRDALRLVIDEGTPYSVHKLHSALSTAGIASRIERGRMVDFMKKSSHFREALEGEA